MEKFPDHIDAPTTGSTGTTSGPDLNGTASTQHAPPGRWLSKNGSARLGLPNGRDRQKSLSDAFRTIRARNGSVSQNAHEIADALRAPLSPKLIVS